MADDRGSLLHRYKLLVAALCDSELSKGDCQVLAVIAGHTGRGGEAWPGVNRIASIAGIHRSTVITSITNLEARTYVVVERKRGCANRYLLASTSSADATGTSRVETTSPAETPVAPIHPASRVDATPPVAPALPDQSRGRFPNSSYELSSGNSEEQEHVQQDQEPADRFAEFWKAYPRKAGSKANAAKLWKTRQLDTIADQLLADVIARKADARQWTDEQYIPHPTTYLNQRRWEEEWKPATGRAIAPRTADDFRTTVYVGSPIEDIPESLRPAANE